MRFKSVYNWLPVKRSKVSREQTNEIDRLALTQKRKAQHVALIDLMFDEVLQEFRSASDADGGVPFGYATQVDIVLYSLWLVKQKRMEVDEGSTFRLETCLRSEIERLSTLSYECLQTDKSEFVLPVSDDPESVTGKLMGSAGTQIDYPYIVHVHYIPPAVRWLHSLIGEHIAPPIKS